MKLRASPSPYLRASAKIQLFFPKSTATPRATCAFSALFLQSSSPQIWKGPILSPGTTLRQKSRALLLDRAWLPTRCHRAHPDDGERLARHLEGAALGQADYLWPPRPPWRERGRGPFWSWRVMDKMLNIRIM